MLCPRSAQAAKPRQGRPAFEVADVFRAHGETYRQSRRLSGDQLKVMRDIEACRTEVLGGHLDVCPSCSFERPSYNSCRNRHCPKCQSLAQARWVEARMERILPTGYFHVVFTLPEELRFIAMRNRVLVFDLLFAAASKTLLELGEDPGRLGAKLGITAVLHTWTRELAFHPHLHCIVTGGGLSLDGERWISARRKYLFPVKVIARLFRGKFLDGLRRAHEAGLLSLGEAFAKPGAFVELLGQLYRTDWHVYSKPPFRGDSPRKSVLGGPGPKHVFRYLGRYTHRIGLSNQRIQSIGEGGVRFATKGGKSITLDPHEFIRRFLLHVLPPRFVKIRHFGLHSAKNAKTRLARARALIDADPVSSAVPTQKPARTWQDILLELTGVDPFLCPKCGAKLGRVPLPKPTAAPRIHLPAILDTS